MASLSDPAPGAPLLPAAALLPGAPLLLARYRRRARMALVVPALILAYLVYAAFAFDLAGLAQRLRWDNAQTLLRDFVSYKIQVTQDLRSGSLSTTVEGDPRDTFPPALIPSWVGSQAGQPVVDLPGGVRITYAPTGAVEVIPGYGTITVTRDAAGKLSLQTPPGPLPGWISASPTKVTVITAGGRLNMLKAKTEVWRTAWGWEEFFFTLDSPFAGRSWADLAALALWQPRLDPAMSNARAMLQAVWDNRLWHHGAVIWAMFETVLMAFLGTFSAGLVALPLAFLAARNIMPIRLVRATMRRIFDFIRGTDALIWTLILARAFGPGPMTGALAILMTDSGAFGKLFSEALENIDERQVEGIRSTGAGNLHRARFGILPQIAPVLLSQLLYAFESNTRSATVIGAIVGGGIGLLLTQAIQTQKDWEDVAYYLILIVLTVMAMDSLSGWLRRKLIKGA
jgi:phosphonate transport system permease protein